MEFPQGTLLLSKRHLLQQWFLSSSYNFFLFFSKFKSSGLLISAIFGAIGVVAADERVARRGNKFVQTTKKLFQDNDFNKGSNSSIAKKGK